jgi:hypothetical protein
MQSGFTVSDPWMNAASKQRRFMVAARGRLLNILVKGRGWDEGRDTRAACVGIHGDYGELLKRAMEDPHGEKKS